MAITLFRRTEPFGILRNFEGDINRWFGEDWFGDDWLTLRDAEGIWTPAVDIEEKDGKYILKAELPGMKKEDIHVELKDGYLTLRGERHVEHEDKGKSYRRVEPTYGSFERTFSLPEGVKENDIHAHYKDGVLELTVPVPEERKPKAIDIKVE